MFKYPKINGYKFVTHCSGGKDGCPHIYQSDSKDHFLVYDPALPKGENKLKVNNADFKALKNFLTKYNI